MSIAGRRYQMSVEIRDGVGREAVLQGGVEDGVAIFAVGLPGRPPAHGFSVTPSQCRDLKQLVDTLCQALDLRDQP